MIDNCGMNIHEIFAFEQIANELNYVIVDKFSGYGANMDRHSWKGHNYV